MLSPAQSERYRRNILLPELGEKGQERLLASKVLIVGAGGLGSPAAFYLAAAGVGTLGIADFDKVDLTNLQRQILHRTADLGRSKAESAAEKIAALNPDVRTVILQTPIDAENARAIVRDWDFIITAVDNFATRFAVSDACVAERKPFSHAGVHGFAGQVYTYIPGVSPDLRQIMGDPEDWGEEALGRFCAGVLGCLCGVAGSIQASEAVKYLAGAGDLLCDRILHIDLLRGTFRESKLQTSPAE